MANCKFCGDEITETGDFCGNCGFIKLNEGDNVARGLIKQFKYLFINPVSFIRTCRLTNLFFTGTVAILIIIMELLIVKGMGNGLDLVIPVTYIILTTFGIIALEALFMFLIADCGYKKKVGFIAFFNLCLSVELIGMIINLVGALLGTFISPYIYFAFSAFGNIFTLLLMYQGIKDFLQADIKIHLITMIGSLGATCFVLYLILHALIQNAINSMFMGGLL